MLGRSSKGPRFPGLAKASPWWPFPALCLWNAICISLLSQRRPSPWDTGQVKAADTSVPGLIPQGPAALGSVFGGHKSSRSQHSWLCFSCSDLHLLGACAQGAALGELFLPCAPSAQLSLPQSCTSLSFFPFLPSCGGTSGSCGAQAGTLLPLHRQRTFPLAAKPPQPKPVRPPGLLCSVWSWSSSGVGLSGEGTGNSLGLGGDTEPERGTGRL